MGENSKIAWTDATFNPWMGCTKCSEGCAHCYAETENIRYGRDLWGPEAPRQRTSEHYWKQPLKWNAAAEKAGKRTRVFCGSWCDVMEAGVYLDGIRQDLYPLIERTPYLDWLLLTKRAENFGKLLPAAWLKTPQPNVWLMTTIENDRHYDRAEALIKIPAVVHGLSLEPLLSPLRGLPLRHIEWVIVGGESGPRARPMHPDWTRAVRDDCQAAGVPFFFKQWGEWQNGSTFDVGEDAIVLNDGRAYRSSVEPDEETKIAWSAFAPTMMARVGKKAAGRLLAGREWSQMPEVRP